MKAVIREVREGESPTLRAESVPIFVFVARAITRRGGVVSLPVDPPARLEPGRGYVAEVVGEHEHAPVPG